MQLFEKMESQMEPIFQHVGKIIHGKRDAVEKALIALLCGGHLLIEDIPGVGKTMLVRAIAKTFDCDFKRIQCTPDLLPSDLTGVSVYSQKRGEFEFQPGPLFANIVMADELNRTSPKTQSAVLEAMAENQVTVDGITHRLPYPFLLLATQNPLAYEGTYRLPEAQLDRFMLCLRLGYPDTEAELTMLSRKQQRHPIELLHPIYSISELIELQRRVHEIHLDESLKRYIVELTAATRRHPDIMLGASPRASFALMQTAQASAFIAGRSYVLPDDIKRMVEPVLAHRLVLTAEAQMDQRDKDMILRNIASRIAVPGVQG